MANIYVRSAAGGAANGTNWANAYLTLTAALAAATSADTVWLASDHSESTAASITLTLPTTAGLKVLSSNTTSTEPPTGLSTTAIVAVSGNSAIAIAGHGYIYGVQFQGSTANNAAADVTVGTSATIPGALILESCGLILRSASTSALLQLGDSNASSSSLPTRGKLLDCTAKFGATGQSIMLRSGDWDIRGLSLDAAGSAPTTLLKPAANAPGNYTLRGCDLSGVAWTNLLDQTVQLPHVIECHNCKLPSGVTLATGTHPGPSGSMLRVHDCDSADTHIRFAEHSYQGSVVQQTGTLIRTGGATQADGTAFSWLMTGNANSTPAFPLQSPQFAVYNTAVGSSVTATVEILRDNATNLTDAQVWLEVDYLGTSGVPLWSFTSDRIATLITTAADQTTSSATWDTTGMSNANKQKLAVTFTPQEAGYIRCRVCQVGNFSVYVDPYVTIA